MRSLIYLIKFILVASFAALIAVTLGIGFAIGGLIFIVVSRLFGRKPIEFKVYTNRDIRNVYERPPMKDVTPDKPLISP